MRRAVQVCFLAIVIIGVSSLIQVLSQGPGVCISGVPSVCFHYSDTGTWGGAAGWDPNPATGSGMFLEYGVAESSGFYSDGDCAVIWSPGDKDILRIYDEDDLGAGLNPLPVFRLRNDAAVVIDDPYAVPYRPIDPQLGTGDLYVDDDIFLRGQLMAMETRNRGALPAGFGDGCIYAAGDITAGSDLNVGGNADITGNLTVVGAKLFCMQHPADPGIGIFYAALEGPEAGTYVRGTTRVTDGEAVIRLPEHFIMVTHPEGLTVSLTAVGQWLELYVVEKSTSRIVVREREGRSGEFDYLVQGVREGFEDFTVLRDAETD
jgi:hypothetical protein